MKRQFAYRPWGSSELYMPMLDVSVIGAGGGVRFEMLVDSGAFVSVLPRSMGRILGLTALGDVDIETADDRAVHGTLATATFRFDGGGFEGHVVLADVSSAVLGHRDFFENFQVTFDSAARIFTVESRIT